METKWINIRQQQPDELQEVAFIVKSDNPAYNNRRMGGRYQRYHPRGDYYEFTTPGVGWQGEYWMPLPELPDELK